MYNIVHTVFFLFTLFVGEGATGDRSLKVQLCSMKYRERTYQIIITNNIHFLLEPKLPNPIILIASASSILTCFTLDSFASLRFNLLCCFSSFCCAAISSILALKSYCLVSVFDLCFFSSCQYSKRARTCCNVDRAT